jgi:hypothetical protein
LALLPEDAPGSEVTKLADAESGIEQGPDNEPLGGRLAGVGKSVASSTIRGSRTNWWGT